MPELTYVDAINKALHDEMEADPTVLVFGEDVARYGNIFGVTRGLLEAFGPDRVRDTPISEETIVGVALGAAIAGYRPVAEIMFGDFLALAMDQIVNQIAKTRYMTGGKARAPLVIRAANGARGSTAAQHSQSVEDWFMNVPGIRLVVPSGARDAYGLLRASIRCEDPVLFLEHKRLYTMVKEEVPEDGDGVIPLGTADVKRAGSDVTVVATARMLHESLGVAEKLEGEGASLEVIDPRTLNPLDTGTILASVEKTGRCVVATEGCVTGGVGGEISSRIMEGAFDYLDAPVLRVGSYDTPIPFSPPLENFVLPDADRIEVACREVLA